MTATGGTVTTVGGNTIHTFASSGTFAIVRQTLYPKAITAAPGHNKALFVIAASYNGTDATGATFDGDAMASVFSGGRTISGTQFKFRVFKLVNPAAKTGDVVVTWDDPHLKHALPCLRMRRRRPGGADRRWDQRRRHVDQRGGNRQLQ